MRILLVEDDPVLSRTMAQGLERAGHRVELAQNVEDAQHWWAVQPFDAVLLDLNLPHGPQARSGLGNGLTALRSARARGDRTPVLVLSARDSTEERIAGLDAGADDYLGKPYELKEVEARLRALARRATGSGDLVTVGRLQLDRQARRCSVDAQALELPAREFELLWELMTPPGRVLSKSDLSQRLSDAGEALGDNALEAFVSRLRRKLAGSGAAIRTLRGLGYSLEEDAS
ncbi:response regulator transcription factor [Paracidovorax cattleyae]|uniref:DNA-binding response regulator, OmpR family, contains REC and winged-helix (WHTH) domain n=1 Tax=Paracidovorax cattleyae TaxID=80868 RepID=A0A1H0UVT9_9BURK|nr:response regulator transcription factor [Paracidovorax cattleyae]AVS74105.1 DNA-binding response regulator [Paracidovorax cattleyae]SDP70260.1 DNA-binding response regulator, OmpR family, contains REC and winged-helix (wHTH) domain [Paracidovorax cattleyae]